MTKKQSQAGMLLGLLSSGAMLLSYLLFSDRLNNRQAKPLGLSREIPPRIPLGSILVRKQRLIGPEELAEALARQREANQKLGEVLVEMGLITEEQLTH